MHQKILALQAKTLHAIAFEASRLDLAGTALLENLESPKAKKRPGKAATAAKAPKVGTITHPTCCSYCC